MNRLLCAVMGSVLALAACGRESVGHSPGPSPGNVGELLVIGNSITRMVPKPELLWFGFRGMAASSEDKDFAHLVGAALRLPLTTVHVGRLEYDASAPLPRVSVRPSTVVVVELGDNGFAPRYADLLASVKNGAALVCTSTWWARIETDKRMQPLCEAAGGRWVYIGDIYRGRRGVNFDDGVDRHPGDVDMAEIARRVLLAIRQRGT